MRGRSERFRVKVTVAEADPPHVVWFWTMHHDGVVAFMDPRRAVVAHLIRPPTRESRAVAPDEPAADSGVRPVAAFIAGSPVVASVDSIEFLKKRGTDDRRLFAVAFDHQGDRRRWFWLAVASLSEDRSTVHGVAGSTDGSDRAPRRPN